MALLLTPAPAVINRPVALSGPDASLLRHLPNRNLKQRSARALGEIRGQVRTLLRNGRPAASGELQQPPARHFPQRLTKETRLAPARVNWVEMRGEELAAKDLVTVAASVRPKRSKSVGRAFRTLCSSGDDAETRKPAVEGPAADRNNTRFGPEHYPDLPGCVGSSSETPRAAARSVARSGG